MRYNRNWKPEKRKDDNRRNLCMNFHLEGGKEWNPQLKKAK